LTRTSSSLSCDKKIDNVFQSAPGIALAAGGPAGDPDGDRDMEPDKFCDMAGKTRFPRRNDIMFLVFSELERKSEDCPGMTPFGAGLSADKDFRKHYIKFEG
jgi:hypothetical protein